MRQKIYKTNYILLLGGSGQLGKNILKSKKFKKIHFPKKKDLNLLNKKQIDRFISKKYKAIINCTGYARVRDCEKHPFKAININIDGITNLVKSIKKNKVNSRLIHISSDAVYNPFGKNHLEKDVLKPYNFYGFTKYLGEKVVKRIKNSVIIRTRFFDKNKIKYNDAAIDIFSSMIDVNKLVKILYKITNANFKGIINVGEKRESDYKKLSKLKKNLKKTSWHKIQSKNNVIISKDSSMNVSVMKRILKY
jgi:dTDP-4-dehydrorhamnose reductase